MSTVLAFMLPALGYLVVYSTIQWFRHSSNADATQGKLEKVEKEKAELEKKLQESVVVDSNTSVEENQER
ncbi:MAG: hypothetical protein ACYCQJ_14330 [Nitrososphaerales archaeon]